MSTFESIALPLTDHLYGSAMRLTRNPTEADDLVQDTMTRALRFWDSFEQGTNVKAWMFTIMRNTFINGYHKRGRARTFARDAAAQTDALGPVGASTDIQDPESALQSDHTATVVHEAIRQLPEHQRLAVILADLEGLTYLEIAEVMDCPIGTVMSRIYRGRQGLKVLLAGHAEELGLVA